MKCIRQLFLIAMAALAGCQANNAAPTPIAAAQIPAEMRKAFPHAGPETTQLVDKMLGALEAKDYAAAYTSGQEISAVAGITKPQLLVTARSMLEINRLLQEAKAQGDSKAAGFIDYQRHNR